MIQLILQIPLSQTVVLNQQFAQLLFCHYNKSFFNERLYFSLAIVVLLQINIIKSYGQIKTVRNQVIIYIKSY